MSEVIKRDGHDILFPEILHGIEMHRPGFTIETVKRYCNFVEEFKEDIGFKALLEEAVFEALSDKKLCEKLLSPFKFEKDNDTTTT